MSIQREHGFQNRSRESSKTTVSFYYQTIVHFEQKSLERTRTNLAIKQRLLCLGTFGSWPAQITIQSTSFDANHAITVAVARVPDVAHPISGSVGEAKLFIIAAAWAVAVNGWPFKKNCLYYLGFTMGILESSKKPNVIRILNY